MLYLVKIQEPLMPDFIIIKTPPFSTDKGIQENFKIKICQLNDIEAEEYGELMKQTFIKHYKRQVARELEEIKKEL